MMHKPKFQNMKIEFYQNFYIWFSTSQSEQNWAYMCILTNNKYYLLYFDKSIPFLFLTDTNSEPVDIKL